MATILLIDDNVEGSAARARLLQRHGHTVQLALDGASGLALALALQPALVLLDHTLPDTTGEAVNARLRHALPDVKVISLSGYLHISEKYNPPADAVLLKGESIAALLRLIEELTR